MIKHLHIVLDDHLWPDLRMKIGDMEVESLYDTAFSNFEVRVSNALRVAVAALVKQRGQPEPAPLRKDGHPQQRGLDDGPPISRRRKASVKSRTRKGAR